MGPILASFATAAVAGAMASQWTPGMGTYSTFHPDPQALGAQHSFQQVPQAPPEVHPVVVPTSLPPPTAVQLGAEEKRLDHV